MRQVRCDQCGRDFMADELGAGTCPSCGRAIVLPPAQAAAAFPALADPITRPVGLAEGVAVTPAATPSPLADRPTAPPPPPLDPMTAPAAPYAPYEPPSLPRSRVAGGELPQPAAEDGSQTRAALDIGAEGAVAAPPLDPTMTMPPGTMPAAAAPIDGPAPRRGPRHTRGQPPRRRTPGWLAAVSAVALLVVLMVGSGLVVLLAMGRLQGLFGLGVEAQATATPRSTASAGPPTATVGFRTYAAPDGSYRIDVPNNWPDPQHHIDATYELSLFYDPSTRSNFEIERITSASGSDPKGTDDLFFAALANTLAHPASGPSGTATVSGKTQPENVSVAGSTWTQETADILVSAGGQMQTQHVVALATVHGQAMYLVAYFAPKSTFDTVDATDFQRMVGSLILLSATP
ncbi:MAG: hypothetical protein PVSMB4_18680 [Ktedonobacterales bacterium]